MTATLAEIRAWGGANAFARRAMTTTINKGAAVVTMADVTEADIKAVAGDFAAEYEAFCGSTPAHTRVEAGAGKFRGYAGAALANAAARAAVAAQPAKKGKGK